MNTISRTLSGIALVILGLYIASNAVVDKPDDLVWIFIWGVSFVIVGLFIFFNKNKNNIEKIKNNKE